jgi:hypothetical protein
LCSAIWSYTDQARVKNAVVSAVVIKAGDGLLLLKIKISRL